jgi:hypothetical protein
VISFEQAIGLPPSLKQKESQPLAQILFDIFMVVDGKVADLSPVEALSATTARHFGLMRTAVTAS